MTANKLKAEFNSPGESSHLNIKIIMIFYNQCIFYELKQFKFETNVCFELFLIQKLKVQVWPPRLKCQLFVCCGQCYKTFFFFLLQTNVDKLDLHLFQGKFDICAQRRSIPECSTLISSTLMVVFEAKKWTWLEMLGRNQHPSQGILKGKVSLYH